MARPKFLAAAATKLFYGDTGEDPTTQIKGIRKFGKFPSSAAREFETTEIDATLDGDATQPDMGVYTESGKEDPGDMNFILSGDDDNVELVYSLKGQTKAWKILLSSQSYLSFGGFIKTVEPQQDEKGDTVFMVTIRVSGLPTFTKAA